MSNTPDLIDADGEVRELTAEDLTLFRPASEVLHGLMMTKLRVREGWQVRVDAARKACEPT